MKNNILMLAGFLGLAACSGLENESEVAVDTETVVTFNDFEGLDGWAEVPESVNKERAYSGKYSIKVDGNSEFSFGFQKQLGQITQGRPKQFTLSAMAFVPSQEAGKAALVLSLTDPVANEQVLYEEIEMEEADAFRKWVKVEKKIMLPGKADFNSNLKIYLWRGQASEPVYVDDLKLTVKY